MIEALGIQHLPLFIAAGLLLNITPGPDMLFTAGSAAARGTRAGVMAALGVGLGCLLHVALAAAGIGALLAASPTAFEALRWLGAGYLVCAGIALLRSRAAVFAGATAPSHASVFWQGAFTNALNPKVALFFVAFLPQFIAPGAEQAWIGMLILGLLFDAGGTIVNIVVAIAAGIARERFAMKAGIATALQRGVGALFVALGVKLALSR